MRNDTIRAHVAFACKGETGNLDACLGEPGAVPDFHQLLAVYRPGKAGGGKTTGLNSENSNRTTGVWVWGPT